MVEQYPALPADAPLVMPRQPRDAPRQPLRPYPGKAGRAIGTFLARAAVGLGAAALTGYAVYEMGEVIAPGGPTELQILFLSVFTLNIGWIGFAHTQAVLGFFHRLWADLTGRARKNRVTADDVTLKTAILMPVYNEAPEPVAAAVLAMAEGLNGKAPGQFAFFILSDSTDPAAFVAEEAVFQKLIGAAPKGCPVYYRHRAENTERKAGNIADWVERFGADWPLMLVLDADSIMEPDTIMAMAARMARDDGIGLLQTLPNIVGGETLYARLQQFANRLYGPVFGAGLAWWHGRGSNFWGHNACIRTRAFADSARLPELSGKPPFGGHILSHDFIEAALLRRAGWGVVLDSDLGGTYEQAPPSLMDVMVRDRRWAQGNLQHARMLFARGLAFASRTHLATGIMAYLSAPIWFLLVGVGMAIAVQVALTRPEYFAEPGLFPNWPVFDAERAIKLFIVAMAVVVLPKVLGLLSALLNPVRFFRFGGPLVFVSVLAEMILSALYAPVLMAAQTGIVRDILLGRDAGWAPQRRDDGSVAWRDAVRRHRRHMAGGVAVAGLAYLLHPNLFYWLLPVSGGLVLAAPLAVLSGSVRAGRALRGLGILRTPEEGNLPDDHILKRTEAKRAVFERHERCGPLIALARNRALRQFHLAQLPEQDAPGFSAARVLAHAKAEEVRDLAKLEGWLDKAEMNAALNDRAFVSRLAQV